MSVIIPIMRCHSNQLTLFSCTLHLQLLGVDTSIDNLDVVNKNEIIYLAVKPYIVPEILREIAPAIGKHHLIVSIAAGVTIKTIEKVRDNILH